METNLNTNKHTVLVEQCQRGDRRAQYDLYKLYAKSMLNVCNRIVCHTAEAEDVLQEAFVEAFTKIDTYRAQATFGAWLKQIVVNRALNHLRKRHLVLVPMDTLLEDDYDVADDLGSMALSNHENDDSYQVERIKKALARLPEGYRVVVSLYLFEGYDHEEIAQILGISESTSRTQYIRGKQKLLEIIKNTM